MDSSLGDGSVVGGTTASVEADRDASGELVATPTGEMLHKQLRWYDTFSMIFAAGVAVFIVLGFTMAALGTWGAVLVAGIVAVIALFQNVLWAEMASMFPDQVGGITLFANQAWKRHFKVMGVLSTFGYWCGWSLVLGVFGLGLGSFVQSEWFPTATWTLSTPWGTHLGLSQFIAIAAVLAAWAMNIAGIRIAAWVSRVLAAGFGILALLFIVVPFIRGMWHAPNVTFGITGHWGGVAGIQAVIVWLYVVGWNVYPTEGTATFAPEYRDTVKDTRRALAAAGIAYLVLWVVMPFTITGAVGESFVAKNPASFAVGAFDQIMGGGSGVAVAIICAALFTTMVVGSADASRALYGMSCDGLTLKQIAHLNRRGSPSRALTIDAVINSLIIVFVSSLLSVLLVANLGYFLAIIAALFGYVLLRRGPTKQRGKFRLGPVWTVIAVVLGVVNTFIMVEGVIHPDLTGYGGLKETLIALGVLALSLVLYGYRRLVQDRSGHAGDRPTNSTQGNSVADGKGDGAVAVVKAADN